MGLCQDSTQLQKQHLLLRPSIPALPLSQLRLLETCTAAQLACECRPEDLVAVSQTSAVYRTATAYPKLRILQPILVCFNCL
jgi:hypothetical protein